MSGVAAALPPPHVRAWYWYAFAAEVFAACALAIFLPITLEQMAREVGFEAPDYTKPCSREPPLPGQTAAVCKAKILGSWVDTASFSMYVKSAAVLLQALGIISIGKLADSTYWRKRLLLLFAAVGSAATIVFLVLPEKAGWLPLFAAFLTLIGNMTYAASIVCANAFLPGLAREDAAVVAARRTLRATVPELEDETPRSSVDEARQLLPNAEGDAKAKYDKLLSLTTSRLSATGVAIGFFSGVSMLALLIVPVSIGKGRTAALELAIGLSGVWWAVFTVPAGLGLPGGHREPAPEHWLRKGWRQVAAMVQPSQVRELPNLFKYLLAWVFLSDGFHTTTYTAILYASSTLHMSASKVVVIGLLVQLAAVGSSIMAPRFQRWLGVTNLGLLIRIVLAAQVLPLYACLGLVLPFGGLRTEAEMYVAAVWFGFLYGPFNSYARAVYAELVPPGHESSFFSLFSLTDKSASFIGPMVVGLISDRTGNIRLGFLFLTAMLALPLPVMMRVRMRTGAAQANAWSEARMTPDQARDEADELAAARQDLEDETRP